MLLIYPISPTSQVRGDNAASTPTLNRPHLNLANQLMKLIHFRANGTSTYFDADFPVSSRNHLLHFSLLLSIIPDPSMISVLNIQPPLSPSQLNMTILHRPILSSTPFLPPFSTTPLDTWLTNQLMKIIHSVPYRQQNHPPRTRTTLSHTLSRSPQPISHPLLPTTTYFRTTTTIIHLSTPSYPYYYPSVTIEKEGGIKRGNFVISNQYRSAASFSCA
jgi:hypothetical protein